MSEYLEYSIDNSLLLHYNKKCQQGADGGSDKQPPKDKKKFLKKYKSINIEYIVLLLMLLGGIIVFILR